MAAKDVKPGGDKTATAKPSAASSKAGDFAWMKPSKGAVSTVMRTEGRKAAKEHSIRYYIFNAHEDAHSVGVFVHGERDPRMSSYMQKVVDDVIRRKTGY